MFNLMPRPKKSFFGTLFNIFNIEGKTSKIVFTASFFYILIKFLYNFYVLFSFNFVSKSEFCREQIKNTMKRAWDGYKRDAWGYDFLAPQSHTGKDLFGLGLTIIDSLDTLLLMNMTEEFEDAKNWINTSFKMNTVVSFFETTIRCLGSLITTYEQTGDKFFLQTAVKLADKLMPAFNTNSFIPRTMINLETGQCSDHSWSYGYSLLADAGSVQLEFLALAFHTGNLSYSQHALDALDSILFFDPMPPFRISYTNTLFSSKSYSFDAFGDSYFEYLLKLYLYAPKNVSYLKDSFKNAIKAASKRLSFTSRYNNMEYLATIQENTVLHKVSHLFFFLPGLLLLANDAFPDVDIFKEASESFYKTAKIFYSLPTGLSADEYVIKSSSPGYVLLDDAFKLRPEYIESLFYLWRLKKDPWARKKAWDIYQSIEKYTSVENGYTTVRDVNTNVVIYQDSMDSFFLSETLKYLYLIFSDDDVVPLSDYVFNTQAHFLKKVH